MESRLRVVVWNQDPHELTYSELELVKGMSVDVVKFLLNLKGKLCHGDYVLVSTVHSCETCSCHVRCTNSLDLLYTTVFRFLQQLGEGGGEGGGSILESS